MVVREADGGQQPRPQPSLAPRLPPVGGVAGAGADGQTVPLQGVHVQTLRPAVPTDNLLVQGDDVGPHLVELILALLLLLQADCHELQHQQIDGGGHRGQSPQQETETGEEGDVRKVIARMIRARLEREKKEEIEFVVNSKVGD